MEENPGWERREVDWERVFLRPTERERSGATALGGGVGKKWREEPSKSPMGRPRSFSQLRESARKVVERINTCGIYWSACSS